MGSIRVTPTSRSGSPRDGDAAEVEEPSDDPSAGPVTIVANDVGGVGGMERQLQALVSGLLARGRRVVVVSRTIGPLEHPGLRWVRVPGPARPFLVAHPWFLAVGTLLVARHRQGVLHTTGAVVLNRADVCTVHYVHNGAGGAVRRARRTTPAYRLHACAARAMSRALERPIIGRRTRTRRLVAVSETIRDEIVAAYPGRAADVAVVPNGVDLDRFRPDRDAGRTARRSLGLGDDRLLALFVGSEWSGKGLGVAIEALQLTDAWELVVVGSGDAGAARALAGRLGVVGRLHLVGETDEPERWYAAADVFVLPSAYESFSLAALEAAASGVPIVATATGAIPELVRDGGGILVERTAQSLAAALAGLAADAGACNRMGSAARSAAAAFDWGPVVDAYCAEYDRAAARPEQPRIVAEAHA